MVKWNKRVRDESAYPMFPIKVFTYSAGKKINIFVLNYCTTNIHSSRCFNWNNI